MRRQGVELWTVRSRKLDPIRAALEGERSNDETARKAQAVAAGIKRQRAKGKPWGEARIGYLIEKQVIDGEVVANRVVDPERRQVVEAIFDQADRGASTGAIARSLNAQGHRTRRGKQFKARTVRAILESPDYIGENGYPQIIDPGLWRRVNEKIKRPDQAAVQNRKGGRKPLADFMLRRLVFCAECDEPMYSIVRHGKRIYHCAAQAQRRGTCSSLKIPADLAERRILEHLYLFVEDVEGWIAERLSERSGEHEARQQAVDASKAALAVLDAKRAKLFAEYQRLVDEGDPLARYALEPVVKLDQEREGQQRAISEAEAVLSEFDSGSVAADAALDFYNAVVDLVEGRIAQASGVADINAALHDSLTGVWLGFDDKTLMAEVRLRPTGDDDLDTVVAELFGVLDPDPAMVEYTRRQLGDTQPRCW